MPVPTHGDKARTSGQGSEWRRLGEHPSHDQYLEPAGPGRPPRGLEEHMGVPKPPARVAAAFKMSPTSVWVPLPATEGKAGGIPQVPWLCTVWSSPGHRHQPGGTGQSSAWSPQVPTASCHQPPELHLFSQPCVVPAPSVLTPDPAGLLFSSFTSPVYLASAPCRGSARLAPAPRCPQVVPEPQHP